jgi:hypothetical protein
MRNNFEKQVAKELGSAYSYESLTLSYTLACTYTPDFIDHVNRVIVESKGFFRAEDRRKLVAVKSQNPEWTICLRFQNPNLKLSKKSKTTYKVWAEKRGFIVL